MGGKEDDKTKMESADISLRRKYSEPTALDKAMMAIRDRPITAQELSGFGMAKSKPQKGLTVCPFVKVEMPSDEDGPKGVSVIVGVKGTF